MTAPAPRARKATPMEMPRARLDRSTASSAPTGSPIRPRMNPIPASMARMNRVATMRSARLAPAGSSG